VKIVEASDYEEKDARFREGMNIAKHPAQQGKQWTANETTRLRQLARRNTPTRVIGVKLQRTPEAIYAKAAEKRISLKPVNQSPYNRRGMRSAS